VLFDLMVKMVIERRGDYYLFPCNPITGQETTCIFFFLKKKNHSNSNSEKGKRRRTSNNNASITITSAAWCFWPARLFLWLEVSFCFFFKYWFFLKKNYVFLDNIDVLILITNFKIKIYYFNIFLNKNILKNNIRIFGYNWTINVEMPWQLSLCTVVEARRNIQRSHVVSWQSR